MALASVCTVHTAQQTPMSLTLMLGMTNVCHQNTLRSCQVLEYCIHKLGCTSSGIQHEMNEKTDCKKGDSMLSMAHWLYWYTLVSQVSHSEVWCRISDMQMNYVFFICWLHMIISAIATCNQKRITKLCNDKYNAVCISQQIIVAKHCGQFSLSWISCFDAHVWMETAPPTQVMLPSATARNDITGPACCRWLMHHQHATLWVLKPSQLCTSWNMSTWSLEAQHLSYYM